MIMTSEQLTIELLKSFCKHYDMELEAGTSCFYLSEDKCMMSGVALQRCMALAVMLGAHFYIGHSPSGKTSFVMYAIDTPHLPF